MLVLTSKERRALLIISAVLLAGIIVQRLWPHRVNTKVYDYTLQDSLFKALSDDTVTNIPHKNAARQTVPPKKKNHVKRTQTHKERKPAPLSLHSIDLNRASEIELQRLPRIGPATARRIVQYRRQNGPFKSVEELIKIKRIGPKTLEKIKPYLIIIKN